MKTGWRIYYAAALVVVAYVIPKAATLQTVCQAILIAAAALMVALPWRPKP